MTRARVVVTGATGLLGPYLADAAQALGPVVTLARRDADIACDLTDRRQVAEALESSRPTVVFHAAAMTDVDRCEDEPETARVVNELAVAHIADLLEHNARLVVVSTDQVYPDAPGPHREPAIGPVNVYGATKLAGEKRALSHPGGVVVRTNFFGPSRSAGRHSLSDFMTDAFASRAPVRLFDDIRFSPLHVTTLVHLLVEVAQQGLQGVYNAGSSSGCTKAEFGLLLAAHLGLPADCAIVGPSASVPGRAPRPHDMTMDVSRLERALRRSMPDVKEEVSRL